MPPHHMTLPHGINNRLNQSDSEKVATAHLLLCWRLAVVPSISSAGHFRPFFSSPLLRTDLAQVGEDTRSTVAAAGWEFLLIFLQFFWVSLCTWFKSFSWSLVLTLLEEALELRIALLDSLSDFCDLYWSRLCCRIGVLKVQGARNFLLGFGYCEGFSEDECGWRRSVCAQGARHDDERLQARDGGTFHKSQQSAKELRQQTRGWRSCRAQETGGAS